MADPATSRQRQLQRRLDVLRDQWRAATAAGDHDHAAAIEAAARQVQADLQHPPAPPPQSATPTTAAVT